jgi:hypothetical protein
MAVSGGFGGQSGTDDLGRVSPPRLTPRRQQYPRSPTVPAPGSAGPHRPRRAVQTAHPPRPRPRPQQPAAARADNPAGDEVRLGQIRVQHNDHGGSLLSHSEPCPPPAAGHRGHLVSRARTPRRPPGTIRPRPPTRTTRTPPHHRPGRRSPVTVGPPGDDEQQPLHRRPASSPSTTKAD